MKIKDLLNIDLYGSIKLRTDKGNIYYQNKKELMLDKIVQEKEIECISAEYILEGNIYNGTICLVIDI